MNQPSPHTTPAERRWVLIVTAIASMFVVLDALVVATALTAIREDLDASLADLEWTINAYGLSFAVLLMTATGIGDRFGRRRVFAAGVGIFAAASAGCALAPDIGWLVAARAVQGAGAALIMPTALAVLGTAFPPDARPKALGIFAGVSGFAVPLGPLLGGVVVDGLAWPWIFWLNVPAGVILFVLVLTRIPESRNPGTSIDIGGLLLVSAGAFGLMWGLVRANSAGWASAEVVSALGAGTFAMLGFVGWQHRNRRPKIPLGLFRSRRFSAGNVVIFFHWAAALGAVFFMAQYLQIGLGYAPLTAGIALMPWGATTVVVPQIAGRLIKRFGERPFIVAGLSMNAAALAWIATAADPGVAYWKVVIPLVLSGAGIAMSLPAAQSSVLTSVTPEHIGVASGVFSTTRQLGGAFGVAILGVIFAANGGPGNAAEFTSGFGPALAVGALLSVVGAAMAIAIPRRADTRPPAPIPANHRRDPAPAGGS